MHRRTSILVLPVVFCAGSVALAETQKTGRTAVTAPQVNLPAELSAAEAVRLALARNPDLLALRKGLAVARAYIVEASLLRSPEVRYGISDLTPDLEVPTRRNNVALRWSPPRPGELGLKSGIARSKAEETADTIAVAEQKLTAEVLLLYHTVRLLDEQIKIADQIAGVREAIVKTIEDQVRAGTKSVLDRGIAELSLAEARALANAYRSEQRLQMGRFASKLDLPPGYDPALPGDSDALEFRSAAPEREKFIAQALDQRMELKAAAERCTQAELALKATGMERYPWSSFVQVNRQFGRMNNSASWGFQVGVEVPVFSLGRRTAPRVSAELEQCRVQQEAVKAAIVAEVDEVMLRLEAVTRDLHYRDAIGPLFERGVDLSRAALAEGQVDAVEVLLAQARQLSAKQAYVTKMMDLRTLEIGLDQALGVANPARH